MGKEIITVSNVRGYIKNEVAYLNVEDIARGLGFTQNKNGVEYVRWETINRYLADFGFPNILGKDDFIPEQAFYLLAMKASNETAKSFQMNVATKILPSIRKHGAYMTDNVLEQAISNPDFMIGLLQNMKEEQKKRIEAEAKIEVDKPKVLFSEAVTTSKTSILIGDLAKIIKQNGVEMGQNRMFSWLRDNGYLIKRKGSDFNMPTQKSMEMKLFEIKETAITHSDGHITINKTPKVTGAGQVFFVNKLLSRN